MTRTRSPTRTIFGALALAMLALLLGSATASAQQVVTATVQGEDVQAPEHLPGDYEAELLVTVEAAGGQCLCKSTQVVMASEADAVVETVVAPTSYEIDWVQQVQEGEAGTHQQALNATFTLPEVEEDVEVTVDVEMTHQPGVLIASQTNPATLVLPVPDPGPEQSEAQGNASTQSVDEDGGDGLDAASVPGPATAGLVAAGIVAAFARRR